MESKAIVTEAEDLRRLFFEEDNVLRWKAERENSSARLDLARAKRNCAFLISQHEPVNSLNVNRDVLREILSYIWHGDIKRLEKK